MLREGPRVISSTVDTNVSIKTNYCLYYVDLKYKIYFVSLVWIEVRINLQVDVGIILCFQSIKYVIVLTSASAFTEGCIKKTAAESGVVH